MSSFTGKTLDEAIEAGIAYCDEYGTIDFDGMNCADAWDEGEDCMGWDGVDRRCDCGNRRVYWASYQQPDGTFVVYGEAY